jgi:cobaltochelatase CobT
MNEKELLRERFKSAVSSAVKVISEKFDLQIKFGNNIISEKNSLNLPEIINLKNLQDFTNLRAFADSEALKIKYTDEKIYLKNEPRGKMAKALYAIAEKIRYEKIGSDKLIGIKNNITQCYENKFKDKKIEEIKTEADVPITEAFELYLRSYFFKIKQNQATKSVLSYWKNLFDKNLKSDLKKLDLCIENQSEFNHIVAELINHLEFEDSDSKEREEKQETKNNESLSVELFSSFSDKDSLFFVSCFSSLSLESESSNSR